MLPRPFFQSTFRLSYIVRDTFSVGAAPGVHYIVLIFSRNLVLEVKSGPQYRSFVYCALFNLLVGPVNRFRKVFLQF